MTATTEEQYQKRINDLLASNNRELEKRREVEDRLALKEFEYAGLAKRVFSGHWRSELAEAEANCWVQSFSGVQYFPLNPRVADVRIEDIAHALSLQCRFAGHVREFYSVGEHCVRIAAQLMHEKRTTMECLWGLLHDASEAYLNDMTRPLKRTRQVGQGYREIESRNQNVICRRFGLPIEQPECVSVADKRILITEKRDLLGPAPAPWTEEQGVAIEPYEWVIKPFDSKTAEVMFLEQFQKLTS